MARELGFWDLTISVPQVIEAMGYKGHVPSEDIVNKIQFLLHEATIKCAPVYTYCIYDGQCDKSSLLINDITFDTGKVIAHSLKDSTRFAIFIASAGILFQQWLESYGQSGDIIDCYILDCIGSEIAERTADKMQETLISEMGEEGYQITNRYSPGYCGWDVSEQFKLFSFLCQDTCGVRLKESGLMYPLKSVSGIIGIGAEIKRKEYGCAMCNYPHCFRRK